VSLPKPVSLDVATSTQTTRRSTRSQSSTLFMGMDAHKDTIAVAYVAQDHGATVTYLGTLGARQGDIDHRVRKMPSKAQHLIFVSEAGPCGSTYWMSQRHLFGAKQLLVYSGCNRATRCACMHGVRGDPERARGTSTTPPATARSARRTPVGVSRRRPWLTPGSGIAQALHREQGHPGGRTREEQRPKRCAFLVMRYPPPPPLFASWPWPRHTWLLVGSS
jgi:hypothetical protein